MPTLAWACGKNPHPDPSPAGRKSEIGSARASPSQAYREAAMPTLAWACCPSKSRPLAIQDWFGYQFRRIDDEVLDPQAFPGVGDMNQAVGALNNGRVTELILG